MKISFIVFLFSFFISFSTYSQTKGIVEYGVNIGYNSSTVSNSIDSATRGNGLNLGVSIDYYFSKRWSIKGKLIYDQKGWDKGFIEFYDFDPNSEGPSGSYTTNYDLNYLTIPVMANWHFGRTKNWYFNFGPYVGFLMSAKETRFGIDVKEAFNTTDFGLAFGIGVKIPVSDKLKISLEYDEQTGFSNIFKESNETITNSRSSFNVGVNFLMK